MSKVANVGKDSKGSQLFNVPNNDEGKMFVKMASKYLNRKYYKGLRQRGRGKRPSRVYQASIPLGMSEWIAVYLEQQDDLRAKNVSLRCQLEDAKRDKTFADATIANLQDLLEKSRQECATAKAAVNKVVSGVECRTCRTRLARSARQGQERIHDDRLMIGGMSINITGSFNVKVEDLG